MYIYTHTYTHTYIYIYYTHTHIYIKLNHCTVHLKLHFKSIILQFIYICVCDCVYICTHTYIRIILSSRGANMKPIIIAIKMI